MATIHDFEQIDIRCGTIIEVLPFPEARKPAYRIRLDFGPSIGERRSCAQLLQNYSPEELLGRQVAAVVNFPPRRIGPESSEVLILGFPDENGNAVFVRPDRNVPIGGRLY